MNALPTFQRSSFGNTLVGQSKRYLTQVVVPSLLLAEHARTTLEPTSPRIKAKENALLRVIVLAHLKQEVVERSPITDADIHEYYNAHAELFVTKERIRLQRLLVATEGEAKTLIEKAKSFSTIDEWRNLVREKSLDKATSERGGELGFVAEDGSTEIPELEVDRVLYTAAKTAKDGDIIATPVAEGQRYAVLYRRGSKPAKQTDIKTEAERIRQFLLEARVEQRLAETLSNLRKTGLREHRPELLASRDFAEIFEEGFNKVGTTPSTETKTNSQ
jgi:peptidyl-prolyl cis-trans isomerase C